MYTYIMFVSMSRLPTIAFFLSDQNISDQTQFHLFVLLQVRGNESNSPYSIML